jgi:hypothetical protein
MPDATVFVQTAQDVAYDPANPDKSSEQRGQLDSQRVQAVQNYLNAYTAGRHLSFEVAVHDPGEVGLSATPAAIVIGKLNYSFQGNLPLSSGAGASGVSGGAGAGGGGGGAAGSGR